MQRGGDESLKFGNCERAVTTELAGQAGAAGCAAAGDTPQLVRDLMLDPDAPSAFVPAPATHDRPDEGLQSHLDDPAAPGVAVASASVRIAVSTRWPVCFLLVCTLRLRVPPAIAGPAVSAGISLRAAAARNLRVLPVAWRGRSRRLLGVLNRCRASDVLGCSQHESRANCAHGGGNGPRVG